MSQDRYSLFPCQVTYTGPTTLTLAQILSLGIRAGNKKATIIPAGMIDPQAIMLVNADPRCVIGTDDLGTALTAISISAGLACSGGGLFQFQKRADGGTFVGAGANVTLTSTKGFIWPSSITADQDDEKGVQLDLEYAAQWDGTSSGTPALPNPPLAIATAANLTGAAAFVARYFLGPVYLGASILDGVIGWKVDPGIEYRVKRFSGDVWAQTGSIYLRKPRLSFRVNKVDIAGTVTSLFNASFGSPVNFYCRKGAAGGARVSDATSQHIKITAATGAWSAEDWQVEGEDDTTVTIGVDVTGTLAANLASTIP